MFIFGYAYLIDPIYIKHIFENYPDLTVFTNPNLNKALVVLKYLQIQDDAVEIDPSLIALTSGELQTLSAPFGSEPPHIYMFPLHEPTTKQRAFLDKLRIVTFNLGFRVQLNKAEGSERQLVELCQIQYPTQITDADQLPDRLSSCSSNAASWLANQNADIIGLQEVANQHIDNILSFFTDDYAYIIQQSTAILYNKTKLGPAFEVNKYNLSIVEKGRPMMIIWFPDVKLLVVNLHAAHNIQLKDNIEAVFKSGLNTEINIDRIIVTGDFNDAYGKPLIELHLLGKTLKQHGTPPKSCCTDRKYQLIGDYIFDSNYEIKGFYGTPDDAIAPIKYVNNKPLIDTRSKNKLMSDHNPVVFYPT